MTRRGCCHVAPVAYVSGREDLDSVVKAFGRVCRLDETGEVLAACSYCVRVYLLST